jgi:two-component system, OmpR family, sensor histidine kinase BaeS
VSPRSRPPWWPENEPFPPARRWGRGYGPPPFVRWIGCFVLTLFGVSLLAGGLAGALFGRGGGIHPFFLFPIFVVIALVALGVLGGVRRMAQPMNNLIEAARRIESGDYSARVPEYGSSDIRSVARAFNSMSARLKSIDEQRRNFMADVTHELRTPLSVIRGQAEAIADGVYPADEPHLAPILDATQTLDRLVDDLKTLVETDAGNLVLHREPTDLAALVQDTVESFQPQAESKGVSLTTEIADVLPRKEVDPSRIRQLISNLMSNAIRHTPRGGSVNVTVDSVGMRVVDTGEGIAPEVLPHVFERFAKGPNSTGSGLGLAIAREIATAHGWKLGVKTTAGTGTSVDVTFDGS